MKIKNLLCAAAMAGMIFSTVNEVGAEPLYNIEYDQTRNSLSVYLDADDTNVEALDNHGQINTLYLNLSNYTNNTSNSVVYNNIWYITKPAFQLILKRRHFFVF